MLSLRAGEKCRKKIVEHLGKTLKDLEESVELLQEWLKTQKHLPEEPSKNMIEFVLVNNKFSIENAKQKLDMYYTIRNLIPELYDEINPKLSRVMEGFKEQYILPMPKLINDLHRVIVLKLKQSDTTFDACVQIAQVVNLYEIRTQEDFMLSDVILFDLKNLTMTHVYKTNLMHAKIATFILEKVYSNRVKEVHVINYPPIFEILFKLAKTVLKPKLIKRIQFHESLENLFKYIPLEILPKDYGGEEKSLDDLEELWRGKLMEYADRFDKLDTLRVNESLRSSPMKDVEKFGVQGTFRKLNVD